MRFIEKPNLPENRVGVVAISSDTTTAINSLENLNIETIRINADSRLPVPVNSHADLQLLHLGKNNFYFQSEHLCIGELKEKINRLLISDVPGNEYPNDVRLNCAIIDNKIICNKRTIAKEILQYAEINGLIVVDVKQGYTKCSVCIVNENAIITDDKSIFSAAQNYFDDVLLVSKNSIRLKGYNYGFIGGCCGKIDKNTIAFNGVLESHADYKLICDFLDKYDIKAIELTRGRLTDIGSIIPIKEIIYNSDQ